MLEKLRSKLEGKKTYILSGIGIIVGLAGVFFGPAKVGPVDIPAVSWNDFWIIVWNSGLFATLRAGVAKK